MIKPTFRAAVPFAIFVAGMTGGPMPSMVAAQERELEEIIVTATKRESDVMDVPASITALSAETLENRVVNNYDDLSVLVPNWDVKLANAQVIQRVRGIAHGLVQGPHEGAVAQHIDGVYIPRTTALRGVYNDLQSIEALRGPQGTLYGRNATGGALNLITNRPTEDFEGRLSLLAGSYDRRNLTAMVSGALSEQILGRLGVYYNKRDGYIENLQPGGDDPDYEDVTSFKLGLRFLPSDEVTIDVTVAHEDWEGSNAWASFTAPQDVIFPIYANAPFTLEYGKLYNDVENKDERQDTIVALNVGWKVSDTLSVRSTTGFVRNDFEAVNDSDGTGVYSVSWHPTSESDTFSQELVIDFSFMEDRLDLIVGGYYYEDDTDFGFYLPLNFIDLSFGSPFNTSQINQDWRQDLTAYAGFLDVTYHVSDNFRVFGGVRVSEEDKDLVIQSQQVVPLCGYGLPVSEVGDDWSDTSPRLGFQWDVSDTGMIYAQVQEGFRSGGYDSGSCNDPFDPEEITAFEVGYKARFNDDRGSVSAAAFYYDYQDLQIQQIVDLQLNIENAASSEVWGFEIEASLLIGDYTTLGFNYAYVNAEFDDYTDCDAILFLGNCSSAIIAAGRAVFEDLSGNQVPGAAEHTFGVSLDQQIPIGVGDLTLIVDAYWTDETFPRQFNRIEWNGYTLVNAFLAFQPESWQNATVRLFAKNLTDEEYFQGFTTVANTSFNYLTSFGSPRTWGVELVYDFQ
ncbi:MAG: TonB-dependent receptor [Gammaproteobacteria bacterium]|nr:TonB-dependent receptor [Gammaproteobacteria bacterium]